MFTNNIVGSGVLAGLAVFLCLVPSVVTAGFDIITYNDTANSFMQNNNVTAIEFDDSGYAWIGYSGARLNTNLVKYEGEFSYFLYGDSISPGLYATWVTSIEVDSDYDVWIGTQTEGVRHFDRDSTWLDYRPDNSGIFGLNIYGIAIGEDNHVWFGFQEAGLSRLSPDSVWTTYQESSFPMDNSIRDVYADSDGNIWTAAIGGLYRFDGALWTGFTSDNSDLPNNNVYSVIQDLSGDYWVGTDSGVCHFDGATDWTCYTSQNSGLAPGQVASLAVDSNGYVWCGHVTPQERDSVWVSWFDGITWAKIDINNSDIVRDIKVSCLAVDPGGDVWVGTSGEGISRIRMTTAVFDDESGTLPLDYSLAQNYPNPFNPTTKISYVVPSRSAVTLHVYDILGRRVTTLVNDVRTAGTHSVVWDGSDTNGRRVASGIYLYRLSAGDFAQTRKMILLK